MALHSDHSDDLVLATLGERLERRRLERNRSQAELAHEAGVSKRTIERIESGASTQFASLVRVLRALGLLERIELLVPPSIASPIEQLRLRRKERRRASTKREALGGDAAAPKPERSSGTDTTSGWQWGDERDGRSGA